MSAPQEPTLLAERGSLVIAESGPRVLILDRGKAPPETAVLVLTVLTLIFGGFGLVSIFSGSAGSRTWTSVAIGAVLLAIGVGSFRAMLSAREALHRVRLTPLSRYPQVAVFDRAQRYYQNDAGELVATLDEVRFERRREFLRSSLVVVTPSGTRVLKRFNVFGGSFDRLLALLDKAVHGASRGSP